MSVLTVCPRCGRQYDLSPRFCGTCGARLFDLSVVEPVYDAGAPVAEVAEPGIALAPGQANEFEPTDDGAVHETAMSDSAPVARPSADAHLAPTEAMPPVMIAAAPVTPPPPALSGRQQTSPPPAPRASDRGMMIALGGAACLILILLGVALYVGGVFSGSSKSANTLTAPAVPASATSEPATTLPPASPQATTPAATTSTAATPTASTPAPPSPPGPSQVIRMHLDDLGSGNYAGAFGLMSASYRSRNPSWTSERSAADPAINIVTIDSPQYGSGGANVSVDFFGRDRTPTPGSDTKCREFQGTVHLVRQSGSWRYDPSGNSLNASVADGNSNCPS
jgi:hypothetical protein